MSNGDETVEVQGTRVPVLGFGTWLIPGPDATEAVRDALEIGYVLVTAYSQLAHGRVPSDPTERRAENFDVFDFELTPEERAEIDALPKGLRTADPPWTPDWDA